jgi:hypothetical protein
MTIPGHYKHSPETKAKISVAMVSSWKSDKRKGSGGPRKTFDKEYYRKYREEHREHIRQVHREYSRKYRENNKEHLRQMQREYYLSHIQEMKEHRQQYRMKKKLLTRMRSGN